MLLSRHFLFARVHFFSPRHPSHPRHSKSHSKSTSDNPTQMDAFHWRSCTHPSHYCLNPLLPCSSPHGRRDLPFPGGPEVLSSLHTRVVLPLSRKGPHVIFPRCLPCRMCSINVCANRCIRTYCNPNSFFSFSPFPCIFQTAYLNPSEGSEEWERNSEAYLKIVFHQQRRFLHLLVLSEKVMLYFHAG